MKDVKCDETCFVFYLNYRLGMAFVAYHLLQAILLIGVNRGDNPRSIIQDGFWPLKLLMLFGLAAGSLWLPRGLVDFLFIPTVLIGAIFLLLQAILLIDLAYGTAESLLGSAEDGSTFAKVSLLGFTLLGNVVNIGTVIGIYYFYEGNLDRSLVTISAVLFVIMSVCSILPSVQDANPSSGLFQSSVIGLYATFLVLSALMGDPDRVVQSNASLTVDNPVLSSLMSAVAVVFAFLCIARQAFNTGQNLHRMVPNEKDEGFLDSDDEAAGRYNYSLFHVAFAMAACYTILYLTFWQYSKEVSGVISISSSSTAFWMRIGSSWLVSCLYMWSLFAPILLQDRSF